MLQLGHYGGETLQNNKPGDADSAVLRTPIFESDCQFSPFAFVESVVVSWMMLPKSCHCCHFISAKCMAWLPSHLEFMAAVSDCGIFLFSIRISPILLPCSKCTAMSSIAGRERRIMPTVLQGLSNQNP